MSLPEHPHLVFEGCHQHPKRLDLSCAKIRRKSDRAALTQQEIWQLICDTAPKLTLRQQQEDVWASDPDFPKGDWKYEVENDSTHQGYWEWVESQREQQADAG